MAHLSDSYNFSYPGSLFRDYMGDIARFPKLVNYNHLLTFNAEESYENIRAVLDNTLTTDHAIKSPKLFKTMFTTGLKNLIISDDMEHHKFALEVLSDVSIDKSELEFVDISGPTAQPVYVLIGCIKSIKKLALEPYRIYGDNAIEYVLTNLNLQELEVRCSSRPCVFRNSESEPNAWHRLKQILAWHMPTLTKLTLSCQCQGNDRKIADEIATIIRILPNKIDIRLESSSRISEKVYQDVWKTLPPQTRFEFCLSGDRTVTTRTMPHSFWEYVTTVDVKRAKKEDVQRLSKFRRLHSIKLDVMDEAEESLKEVPMRHIKLLHLSASPAAVSGSGGIYYELQRNTFVPLAQGYCLEDVRLLFCRVSRREIQMILLNVGKRLKRFETSLLDQIESPSRRLLHICDILSLLSTNLRHFNIVECVMDEVAAKLTWGMETYERYSDLFVQLDFARQHLARTAPLLDTMHLCDLIQSLKPNRSLVESMRADYHVFFGSDEE